jgi:hypothetical protein
MHVPAWAVITEQPFRHQRRLPVFAGCVFHNIPESLYHAGMFQ